MNPHRIAAGGIILKDDSMLLVRYGTTGGGSFLVGPGGALDVGENAVQAIIRETLEETGVMVQPRRVLWIEDLQSSRFKMCKIWMLCDVVRGDVMPTDGARAEGITEVGWYSKSQLEDEIVYPPPVMQHDWDEFRSDHWETQCLPSRAASFLKAHRAALLSRDRAAGVGSDVGASAKAPDVVGSYLLGLPRSKTRK